MKVSEIKKFLSENQTWAKKSFGQHFLIDERVLDKIVATAELSKNDRVLEIGPGLGVLTERLVEDAGEVIAIEADNFLAEILSKKYQIPNNKFQTNDKSQITNKKNFQLSTLNFRLIQGDALQVIDSLEFKESFRSKPYKVVANIPYSITSKLLRLLLEEYQPTSITFLVQKEVAQRVCAEPGEMSLLSLSVQYFGEPKIMTTVPPGAFWPQPKIDSSILAINKIQDTRNKKITNELFKLARIGFSSKRKMLAHNLSVGLKLPREQIVAIIIKAGLKETVRAQELSVENWQELAKLIQ